eukprot:TRINITY_DN4223_c0_g1_i2.p1 TRINITY_DN4223_c0_g1~~TRINITY_DN4223_c0_g1_i2.p1  ORF type:complete len:307 (+),score=93.50 TRINITY_DN4223_c0_g1_i2:114-1034(+)
MKQRRPWQRVLYRDQGYADDYVDPDYFLSGLVTNAHFKRYDYWQVVRQSAVVSQQVSAVGVFVAVYVNLVANVVSARALFAADAVLLLMGCLIVVLATNPSRLAHLEQLLESARPLAILFAALFALSPMLATLTASFSSDTIYSTSTLLVILHLYTHNYCDSKEKPAPAPVAVGGESEEAGSCVSPVSLYAITFASLLLASRLPTPLHVFDLVSYTMLLFALFPFMKKTLKNPAKDNRRQLFVSVLLCCVTTGMWFSLSRAVACVYLGTVAFITFGCPFWLIHIQKDKYELNGPWDEAKPSCAQNN